MTSHTQTPWFRAPGYITGPRALYMHNHGISHSVWVARTSTDPDRPDDHEIVLLVPHDGTEPTIKQALADVDFLTRAVNAHKGMVELLERASEALRVSPTAAAGFAEKHADVIDAFLAGLNEAPDHTALAGAT